MEIADVLVRLGGDKYHEVVKTGVTPSEALVLMSIHNGSDAIANVKHVAWIDRSEIEEISRLRSMYGRAQNEFDSSSKDNDHLLKVFGPALHPKLVNSFKEIGIESNAPAEKLAKKQKNDSLLEETLA